MHTLLSPSKQLTITFHPSLTLKHTQTQHSWSMQMVIHWWAIISSAYSGIWPYISLLFGHPLYLPRSLCIARLLQQLQLLWLYTSSFPWQHSHGRSIVLVVMKLVVEKLLKLFLYHHLFLQNGKFTFSSRSGGLLGWCCNWSDVKRTTLPVQLEVNPFHCIGPTERQPQRHIEAT